VSTDQHSDPGSGAPSPAFRAPSTDVLAAYDDGPPARRASWLLVGGAGLLVLGLVGGVTYGVGRLSGGGTQPEDALPGGAFGYVKVDLDPSAGQKIDGFRFLRKFPALRDRLGSDDLREVVFDTLADGVDGWEDVDFAEDVAPWMGQRLGAAAYPPAATDDPFPQPSVVLALQVSDAAEARKGLDRLADLEANELPELSASGDRESRLGFVVTDDYALLAEDQETADRAARDAARSTLAQDGALAEDLAAAGDGVMAAWIDMDRAVRAMGPEALGPLSMLGMGGIGGGLSGSVTGLSGRSTYVARFDGPDVFELTGRVTDAETVGWSTHPVKGVAELPESSVVALGIADGDELVQRAFESLREAVGSADGPQGGPGFDDMVRDAERGLGIDLPDDVAALLGDNLVAALDGTPSDSIEVGARVTTDVTRAERVLDALQAGDSGDWAMTRQRVGDDLVVASTRQQAARLAAGGTLGERAGFRDALPGLADADVALWVDVKGVARVFTGFAGGPPDAEVDPNLEPIEGLGMTMSSREEGSGTFSVRLVAR
jgi:hypothetical protein